MLRYCIGTIEKFKLKGVDIEGCRKSVDGVKAVKHIELLTDDEFNIVRLDPDFDFKSDDNISELMESAEWKAVEK